MLLEEDLDLSLKDQVKLNSNKDVKELLLKVVQPLVEAEHSQLAWDVDSIEFTALIPLNF